MDQAGFKFIIFLLFNFTTPIVIAWTMTGTLYEEIRGLTAPKLEVLKRPSLKASFVTEETGAWMLLHLPCEYPAQSINLLWKTIYQDCDPGITASINDENKYMYTGQEAVNINGMIYIINHNICLVEVKNISQH